MRPQGTKLVLSTFDPKEREMSERHLSTKVPCEVACDDPPSGGEKRVRTGMG